MAPRRMTHSPDPHAESHGSASILPDLRPGSAPHHTVTGQLTDLRFQACDLPWLAKISPSGFALTTTGPQNITMPWQSKIRPKSLFADRPWRYVVPRARRIPTISIKHFQETAVEHPQAACPQTGGPIPPPNSAMRILPCTFPCENYRESMSNIRLNP